MVFRITIWTPDPFLSLFLLETRALSWEAHGKLVPAMTLGKASLSSLLWGLWQVQSCSLHCFPSEVIHLWYSSSKLFWSISYCNSNLNRLPPHSDSALFEVAGPTGQNGSFFLKPNSKKEQTMLAKHYLHHSCPKNTPPLLLTNSSSFLMTWQQLMLPCS